MSDDSLEVRRITLETLREKLAATIKAREAATQDEAVRRYLSLLRGCELLTEAVVEAEKAVARAKVGAPEPDIAQPVARKPTTPHGAQLRAAFQLARTGGPVLAKVKVHGNAYVRVYREPFRRMVEYFRGRTFTAKDASKWFENAYGTSVSLTRAYIQHGRQDGTIFPPWGVYAAKLTIPAKYEGVTIVDGEDEAHEDPNELRKAGLLR